VQILLAENETSFLDEVIERRLRLVYEMLTSPRHAHMRVTDIANQCGFSTLSHFHRMFRRRYDATPSDVRAAARSAD
jgi:AraC-like DNA-binding protein